MWKIFWQYSGKFKWILFVAPVVVLGEVVAELQQPNLLAQIVNTYEAGGEASIIWSVGGKMLGFLLFSIVASLISVYLSNLVAAHFGRNIRKALFGKIQSLSLAQVEKLTPGALLTRLTNDITQAQNLLVQVLRVAARAPLMFLGSLFFLAQINTQLLEIVLILSPLIILIVFLMGKFALPIFQKLQKITDKLNNQMSQSLRGIKTVKSFNKEESEVKKFGLLNTDLKVSAQKSGQIIAMAIPAMMFVFNLAIALVLNQGGELVGSGAMEVGTLIAAIGYLSQLLFAFLMVSFIFIMIMRTRVSVSRIKEIMQIEPDLYEAKETSKSKIELGEIEFKNVSFSYSKDCLPAIENLSLKIGAGSTVGIIGTTGSGKSTIARLLNRLYDPSSGSILIDGVDLRDYPLQEVKEKVIIVLQQAILLSGTVEENLVWGESLDESKIALALNVAQAEGFINQEEEKLKRKVASKGANFSGGQRQRLSLARALSRNGQILVMDDTTSALDMKTAQLVQEGLAKKVPGQTKIIISQRISSVRDCEQIFVLEDGKLHNAGTHQQLLKKDKIYQEIDRLQKEDD